MKIIRQFISRRPAEKRLTYFYAMVTTDEQVWLLRNQRSGDLFLLEGEENYEFSLPVWPTRSFAEMEAEKIESGSFEAFNVPLAEFLDDMLVDVEEDCGIAEIFPNGKDAILQTRDDMKEIISKL